MRTPQKVKTLLLILVFLLPIGLFQFSVANNRMALNTHLKPCNYPKRMQCLNIHSRQHLWEWFGGLETYAEASFETDTSHLRKWIYSSDFEVLTTGEHPSFQHFTKKKDIPEELFQGKTPFSFQFKHRNGERTVISVNPIGYGWVLVDVRYCVT